MDINKALVQGLCTHPLAPLAVCPLVLGVLFAWLLQPLLSEHRLLTESLKTAAARNASQQPAEAEGMYIFELLSDVIPWLMENAEVAGIRVGAITQAPEQDVLLLDLRGSFSHAAAFIERVLHGTNLMVQPPLRMTPAAGKASDLRVSLRLSPVPGVCLKRCKQRPPVARDIRPFNDGFAAKEQLAALAVGHVLPNVSVQQMSWVGHLTVMTESYELVQVQPHDVVLVPSGNRFGVEKVTVEGLPGWGDSE